MKRNVILLPHIVEEIKQIYSKKGKLGAQLTKQLQEDFSPQNRGLLYREDGDKIKIYTEDISLLCVGADERNSLKAVIVKEVLPYQFHFAIERGQILEGTWDFINISEARDLDKKVNDFSDTQMEFIEEELRENRENAFSEKENIEYKRYVEYWEKHDIVKKYEEENLLEKKKASVVEYRKFKIDFDKDIIKFQINKTSYGFKTDERIVVASAPNWYKNYQLNNEHMKWMNGFDIGAVHRLESGSRQLLVKSTPEKIRFITENKDFEDGFLWCDDKGSKSKIRRESEALKKLFKGETVNKRLREFVPEIGVLKGKETERIKEELLSKEYSNFKEKQQEAVKGALSCSDIYLVQGPPGTGKTTVISEIIQYLVNDNKKVLLSSQTNLAVDNVLQRIGEKESVRAIRIGSEEKFELDSKKYALDQRVNDLQQKMLHELASRRNRYKELEQSLKEAEDLYKVHMYVSDKIKSIINILTNFKQSQMDIVNLNTDKAHMEHEVSEALKILKGFEKKNKGCLTQLETLSRAQERSLQSIEENILSYKLDSTINFTLEEEEDIINYSDIIDELKKAAEFIEGTKLERERLKEEMLQIVRCIEECSSAIEDLRSQEYSVSPGIRTYLLEDIEKYESNYESLKMDFKEYEYKIKEIQARQKEKQELAAVLRNKALNIKEKLEYYININTDSWMETFNTPKITKEQFLEAFRNLKSFREEFSYVGNDVHMLINLPEYEKYIIKKSEAEDAERKLDEIIKMIASKDKYRDKFEEKIKEYQEDKLIDDYLKHYNLNIEDLEVKTEASRCKQFKEDYSKKLEEIKLYKASRDIQEEWSSKLEFYQESFENIYINISNLICATCLGIASSNNNYFLDTEFDYVIIDEAARASSMELLIPMTRGKKIVLVGDHKQISPEIEKSILDKIEQNNEIDAEEINNIYKKSLFGLMYEDASGGIKTFLDKQFRMSSDISALVSRYYYDKQLKDGENIINKSHGLESLLKKSFYWVDTPASEMFMEVEENKSYFNIGEVNIAKAILKWLNENVRGRKSIGVISPYKAQMNKFIDNISLEDYENLDIEINTIDAFQGREKNIIIMTMVRNNNINKIGHIGQDSRMNVALSRAQELLFTIGNKDFIVENKNKVRKVNSIIEHLEKKKCILQENYFIG